MEKTTDFAEISNALVSSLDLKQVPIAIAFVEDIPEDVGTPGAPVPAGCQFWEMARSNVFVTSAADHYPCAVGTYTHHLEPSQAEQVDLQDALAVFADLSYVRSEDIPLIPVLDFQPKHILYGPLARLPVPPNVVLLFVDANQALLLSEAAQQVDKQSPTAMGRPGCAVVPQVKNTGCAALSLGCCGARAYLDVLTETLGIFALPGHKLANYTERIEALAQANATLTKFHRIRRRDIAAGKSPSIKDSLRAMQ
jgi:uncharacterized protein (DUF169 family)